MSPFVNCRCGRLVGVRTPDGWIEVRHKGRKIRAWLSLSVTCEDCGTTTSIEALDKRPEAMVSVVL